MAVRIYLEIGHEASIRTKKTQEGFTHDWEVFVRGIDGAEIHYYVEKVVFYLHETFPKPKRVVKEPPYSVKESGYAGFNLPIDIYLRNNNDPKKIRFNYDLHLQPSGPPIFKVQKEKYVFNSPSDDFKMKLLKGGGTIGSSSSIQEVNDNRSSTEDKNQMINKPKLSGSEFIKKPKMKMGEPCRDFQELFGSPINMSSKSSEQKLQPPKPENKETNELLEYQYDDASLDKSRKHSPHKDGHKDKEKSKDKIDSDKKNRDEKKQKDKSKDRERSKDKSVRKEKSPRPQSPSPKRSPKRSASPSRFSSPTVIKHKESKHDKEKRDKVDERKPKKDKKNKDHKENKHGDDQKSAPDEHKDKSRGDSKKDSGKTKIEQSLSPLPPQTKVSERKEKSGKEKSLKDSSKDDKYSEKYKHKKKDKEKRDRKEEKTSRPEKRPEKSIVESKPNLFKSESQPKKEKSNYHDAIVPNVDDETSNSSSSSSSSSSIERVHERKLKSEPMKIKEETKPKIKKEKGYQENTIKCKRKSNSMEPEEPPQKMHKEQSINNNSDVEQDKLVKPVVPTVPEPVEEDYFGLLRDLQHKIMGLKDNSDLQKVVKLIAETGRYEVSAHTFDFDLCLLDRSTVKQLQEFFASET